MLIEIPLIGFFEIEQIALIIIIAILILVAVTKRRRLRQTLRYRRICDVSNVLAIWGLFAFFVIGLFYWVPKPFESSNWSFIGLTLILIWVMIWQTWRNSSDLTILPFDFGKKPIMRIQEEFWSGWRWLTFEHFQFAESESSKIDSLNFEVGNKGSQGVTVHECRIHLEYPERKEDMGIDYIWDAKKEGWMTIGPGDRIRRWYPLEHIKEDGLHVYRVELYTIRMERTRWWIIYRRGTHIYCCDVGWKTGINYESLKKKLQKASSSF